MSVVRVRKRIEYIFKKLKELVTKGQPAQETRETTENQWQSFKNIILKVQQNELISQPRRAKQNWMTEDFKTDERRKRKLNGKTLVRAQKLQ